MQQPTLRDWLACAPFTLTLSSGFFGFFAHAGVLRALEDAQLLPSRITGSSAGALAGGAWAAGVSAGELISELTQLERADFWDPGLGLGLLRGQLFGERMRAMLPVSTFAACRVPVAVSVFDVIAARTRVIDSGQLVPAIVASCSVPLLFAPVWQAGRPLVDGGVRDRPGLASVVPGERVLYHHLTSRLPWAFARSALKREAPRATNLATLVFPELPRVDPFRLDAGRRAIVAATRATRAALAQPVRVGA